MHFIPNPAFRLGAFILAVVYCGALVALISNIRLSRPSQSEETPAAPAALLFGIFFGLYFYYVSCFVSFPALLTDSFGAPAAKDFVIEEIDKGGSRARGCPYRLKLQGVVTVLDDTFCVSAAFASQHEAGQSIRLTGAETVMGFRFRNVDWL